MKIQARHVMVSLVLLTLVGRGALSAEESVERIEGVVVEADYDTRPTGPFLPDVEGTRINAGKKTSNIQLEELPEISNDNYRQVIATTPGLVLAEESTPLVSIGYRGYEPHRMQYFQVLEDGIPIHADMLGYLNVTAYDETHGEPGGLTLATGPNTVNYDKDRNATSRFHDRMRVSRYAAALIHENDLNERTLFTFRAWWDYYQRWSRRQRGGGFGTLPTGPAAQTNQIENQQFYTFGVEPRIRHDWDWLGNTHTLTAGAMLYNTWSPRTDSRGTSPTAQTGPIVNQSYRQTWYLSSFAENRFQLGKFSITPGVRIENIWQSVRETVNASSFQTGEPLADESVYNFVPLFGLGAEYAFTPEIAAYGNVSQAYRPPVFTQAVPTSPNTVVDGNLQESFVVNYEVGFRGNAKSWITWDTSLFVVDNSDLIGTSTTDNGNTTVIQNSGRAVTFGWDLSTELDLVGLADQLFNPKDLPSKDSKEVIRHSNWVDTYGSLSVYTALTLMDAKFLSGQNSGKTPQYSPDYLLRVGAVYNWRDRIKVALMGNFVGSSYADDTNTAQRFIPAYNVWDITVEAKVYKDYVSIIGGVNNVFDNLYYARIRPDGIDPAMPRNWYVGAKVEF